MVVVVVQPVLLLRSLKSSSGSHWRKRQDQSTDRRNEKKNRNVRCQQIFVVVCLFVWSSNSMCSLCVCMRLHVFGQTKNRKMSILDICVSVDERTKLGRYTIQLQTATPRTHTRTHTENEECEIIINLCVHVTVCVSFIGCTNVWVCVCVACAMRIQIMQLIIVLSVIAYTHRHTCATYTKSKYKRDRL